MRNVIRTILAAVMLMCAGAAPAQVHWYFVGEFNDGADVSGEFDINSYGFVGNSYIETGSGTIYATPTIYGPAGTSTNNDATNIGYYRNGYTDSLTLRFADDLNFGSTYNQLLATSFECRGDNGCPYEASGTYRYLVSGHASVEAITAVPEPAIWAMMITGFGLVGAATRRARQPVFA